MAEVSCDISAAGRLKCTAPVANGVHPPAVRAFKEIGIDISSQRSKNVDEFANQTFDVVITLCDSARESCPTFPRDPERIRLIEHAAQQAEMTAMPSKHERSHGRRDLCAIESLGSEALRHKRRESFVDKQFHAGKTRGA
jgi:protein-tyrosine-phosphatase